MADTYNVEFSAGSTEATGLPIRQVKVHDWNLKLPTIKPSKASVTSGGTRTDYTFKYWEGTPVSTNHTTTTSWEDKKSYQWPIASVWMTNAYDGISFQPKVDVWAGRGESLRVIINVYMNHTYGDCIGSSMWLSNTGSDWNEAAYEAPKVNYQGTTTCLSWDYTWPSVNPEGWILFYVQPARYQPYAWGQEYNWGNENCNPRNCSCWDYWEGSNHWYYVSCPTIIFKIVWNAQGVEVLPAATSYNNQEYSSRQYAPGDWYTENASITLYPYFATSEVNLNTDSWIYYNGNGADSGVPNAQKKPYGESVKLKLSTVPIRSNYTFTGWFTDSACTKKRTTINYSADKDLTLYAGWVKNDYIINYYAGDYTGVTNLPSPTAKPTDIDVFISTKVPKIASITQNGYKYSYTFDHWEASQNYYTTTSTTVTASVPTTVTSQTSSSSKDWGATAQWWNYNSDMGITVTPGIKVTATRMNVSQVTITMSFQMVHNYGDCIGCGFWYSIDGGSNWTANAPESTIGVHYQGTTTYLESTIDITTGDSGFINLWIKPCTWYYLSQNQPTSHRWDYESNSYYLWDAAYFKIPYVINAVEVKTPTMQWVEDTSVSTTTIKTSTKKSTKIVTYKPGDVYSANQSTNMYAVFTETKKNITPYDITYHENGGNASSIPSSQTKIWGDKITLSDKIPTRNNSTSSGYTYSWAFDSWNTTKSGTGKEYKAGSIYSDNADLDLYAQWNRTNITEYTCTFNANGGVDAPDSVTHIHNKTTTLPKTKPTRANAWEGDYYYKYTFVSWNTQKKGKGDTYNPGDKWNTNSDQILYAQWSSKNITEYTITFDYNGGSKGPEAQTHLYDVPITLSSTKATRSNGWEGDVKYKYTFKNWNTRKSGTGITYNPGDVISSNLSFTLYAQWDKTNITPCTITYDANGGYESPDATVTTYNVATVIASSKPSRKNGWEGSVKYKYTFKNWNTNKSGTGTTYNPGDAITVRTDITLYAQWDKTNITPCTITYDANGGDTAPSATKTIYNVSTVVSSSKPTRNDGWEGAVKYRYTFKDWNTNKSGTGDTYNPGDIITIRTDITLYAQWDKLNITPYTIKLYDNNSKESVITVTQIHDNSISLGSYTVTTPDTYYHYDVIFGTMGYYESGNDLPYTSDNPKTALTYSFTDTHSWKLAGWSTSRSGSVVYKPTDKITPNRNTILYAIYEETTPTYSSTKCPTTDVFYMDEDGKPEDGFVMTLIPRWTGMDQSTVTAIDTVMYTLKKWQQMKLVNGAWVKDEGVYRSNGSTINSASSNINWEYVRSQGSSYATGDTNKYYRTYLRPVWKRTIMTYGTSTLPKLSSTYKDKYNIGYKFCGWTDVSTYKDGFTTYKPKANTRLFAIWEPIIKHNPMIMSDYLYDTNTVRSWFRLMIECSEQVTTDIAPIPIASEGYITTPYPVGYNDLIKTSDMSGTDKVIATMTKLTTCTDTQGRKWYEGCPDPTSGISATEYATGTPITAALRDKITAGIARMRKWVKVY